MLNVVMLSLSIIISAAAMPNPSGRHADTEDVFRKWKADEREVLRQLQGEWSFVRNTKNGGAMPRHVDYLKMKFEDQKYRTEWKELPEHGGKEVQNLGNRFVINPAKSPKEITFYGDGHLIQGIYSLDGDDLKLAFFGISELERPRGFTVEQNPGKLSGLVVWTLRRKNAD